MHIYSKYISLVADICVKLVIYAKFPIFISSTDVVLTKRSGKHSI